MYRNLDPSLHPVNSQAQSGVLGWLSNGFVSALPQPSGSPLPGRANSDSSSRVSMKTSEMWPAQIIIGIFPAITRMDQNEESVCRCGQCLGPVILIKLFNISSSCYSRSIITAAMMVDNWHEDIRIKRKHHLSVLLIFVFFFFLPSHTPVRRGWREVWWLKSEY